MARKKVVTVSNKQKRSMWPVLGGVGLAIASIGLGWHLHISSPKYVVENDIQARKSLPSKRVELENVRTDTSQETQDKDLEFLLNESRINRASLNSVGFQNSSATSYINFEQNGRFASQLIKLGKDSIDHIVKYIDSPYIEKENLSFEIPKKKDDISPEGNIIYLVAGLGEITRSNYRVTLKDGKSGTLVKEETDASAGENNISILVTAREKGFDFTQEYKKPIFYNTSQDKVYLIETFAIEALHRMVRKYTHKNIAREISEIERTYKALYGVLEKWKVNEEAIVHAISIHWLKQYNADRKLGLSETEMNERFARYLLNPRYSGVASFSTKLETLGVQRVMELYATQPDTLFESRN